MAPLSSKATPPSAAPGALSASGGPPSARLRRKSCPSGVLAVVPVFGIPVVSRNDGEAVRDDEVFAVEQRVADDRVLAHAQPADRGAPSMRAEGHGLRGD